MKNDKKLTFTTVAFLGLVSASSALFASGSCNEYPNMDTEKMEFDESGNWKIIKTGEAIVSIDDAKVVKDAKTEATLKAKAAIAHFIKEDLTSETVFNEVVKDASKIQQGQKSVDIESIKTTVTKIRNSANELLKGVTVLGDCYTKNTEVRVTVGVKSDTIKLADTVAKDMKSNNTTNEKSANGTAPTTQSPNSTGGIQGVVIPLH
jgi:hypothetical protein